MQKCVVLLSGGLDSSVTAFVARKDIGEKGHLHALTFDYGQKHRKEIEAASKIAIALEAVAHVVFPISLGQLSDSALLSSSVKGIPTKGVEKGIPTTWVPQRNSIFLALAFIYAETIGADRIYIGVNSRDYSGYPDCRPEFIAAITTALNLASKRFVESGKGIGIVAPLQYKYKAEIVRLGSELGVPFILTWSCYQGKERACGVCDSCRLRRQGFEEAGLEDPLRYVGNTVA